MREGVARNGPEAVAFAVTTPAGTAVSDGSPWIERLIRLFGSPNTIWAEELCAWHRDYATPFTFGVDIGTPDFPHTGCLLLWGHNPSTSFLAQATAAAEAKARGAALIVVDPRRAGLANRADQWLRVRPGTDGALALALAGVMIAEGWVLIETARGTMRARARLNGSLARDVVCAQFGWWQACEPLGLPGYDVVGPGSANYNSVIGTEVADPVSGTIPLRSYLCEVRKASL